VVANAHAATAFVSKESGEGFSQGTVSRPAAAGGLRLPAAAALGLCLGLLLLQSDPAAAASNKVRITNLTDVAFGTIGNFSSDAVQSQSVCLYADTNTNGYNITATGSGSGGAFGLSSGLNSLAYDVQWNSSAGQSSGTQLTSNVPLTGQVSSATHQTCNNGPATSASLIVILRAAALSSASAGSYSGTLTLVVGPE
jgi:hypothetical protein